MGRVKKMEKLEPRALHVKDFIKAYGIGRTKLYALIRSGQIKTVKIGRRRLIPRDVAEDLIRIENNNV